MVFACSGLESVRIPSTLKEISALTFSMCGNLKCVELSEGLEVIGTSAFNESGIESIVLPSSTRILYGKVFAYCKYLRSV